MIRVAILGAGIGAQHLDGYQRLGKRFEVRYLIDRDPARAREVAKSVPIADDIDIALSDPEVDLVDICLPPHLHVPVTLAALAAGKDVICEKPIATSLADVARLRNAQADTGRHVFPVFQYRFGPAMAAMKALVRNGLAGRPLVAALETHWSRGSDYYAVPWRGTWSGEMGGAVLGHAIHAHDLLTHVMGPVGAVTAHLGTRVNPIETEDCAAIAFEMQSGALATSSVTLGAANDETRLRFVFDGLTATSETEPYAPATGSWQFEARNPADQPAVDAVVAETRNALSGFSGAFNAVADALEGRPENAVMFADGAASVELVTAIYHAARSGRRVRLPIEPGHPLWNGWIP